MEEDKHMRVEEKEALFVAEYLKDFNAAQAAVRAGYSEKRGRQTGHDLLQKPDIQAAIQYELAGMVKKIKADAEYVLRNIIETIERSKQARPVLDKKGFPVLVESPLGDEVVPAYTYDASAVLKGCELLGKHLKMFTDKIELSGNVSLAERIKAARERTK